MTCTDEVSGKGSATLWVPENMSPEVTCGFGSARALELTGAAASCWVVAIRLIYQLACQLFRWLALLARSSAAKTSRS
ncbi:hypothetical protein GCM10009574_101530 [Streptomyces asiaticus]|uniref:Uncharacterized protein n=2 Tax=Streptomyces rhizosphaericus TaxID=114699 RepID=A0ABP4CFH1_9ACTN